MKLCKDCKHAVLPHPLQYLANYSGQTAIYSAMCGHPDASRSVVDGSLKTACEEARGTGGSTAKTICWYEARLFEQRPPPPAPEIKPYQVMHVETEEDRAIWKKVKRWFI